MPCECVSVLSVVADCFAVVIGLCAVVVSLASLISQRKYNRNSVRPILNIVVGDYLNDIYVRIENKGVGPAVITSTCCEYKFADGKCFEEEVLYELIDSIGISGTRIECYTDFVENIKNRTISQKESVTLMEVSDKLLTEEVKKGLRMILKDVTITVEYENVYRDKFTCRRELTFFGR